jgi:predicted Fe-Mo cluster-binding NifX family protein
MMKVAIPHWDSRVSPVFDVAGHLLVVELKDGQVVCREEIELAVGSPRMRAMDLAGLDVDVLICGAISWSMEAMLLQMDIEVLPQICGGVDCVLSAFIAGELDQEFFRMPGCGERRRRNAGRPCGRRRRHQGQTRTDTGDLT